MVILIDGPSGSGKTTVADRLGAALGWPVVHMDDFYPGWSGLAAGRALVPNVIIERRYRRWDWEHDCEGSWVAVPEGNLIVEGVGAVSAASIGAASIGVGDGGVLSMMVWAPEAVRKARALARDPEYAPYWEMWAAQERQHFATMPPVDLLWRA